ncbi:MAG: pilus assembly protein TadB [Acidimicrobiaceae bacterium]|nr:pilus assembly protein TadB [Acidimicrobiaceae bacterium]
MTALAALAGFLAVGGLALALMSWRPVPDERRAYTRSLAWDHRTRRRVALAAAGFLVTIVVTRWPVAAVAAGVAGWVIAGSEDRRVRRDADRRTEAIALWAEMLRDAIGTSRGVEGVLVATASTAPLPIRDEVQRMARRLEREPLDSALDGLAGELNHPLGDLVVTALRLTSTAGGRQVRDVLSNLASAAYAEAESARRIEVARERPRAAMRYTAMIIGGFVLLLVVFSRSYLEPYESAVGQIVLAVVGFYWAAGFWWMHRMGRSDPVERFLAPTHQTEAVR